MHLVQTVRETAEKNPTTVYGGLLTLGTLALSLAAASLTAGRYLEGAGLAALGVGLFIAREKL